MTDSSLALDEAYDRMAGLDFELPNGFVNHGPMACEALDALDLDDAIDGWARRMTRIVGEGPVAAEPRDLFASGWQDALGDYRRLPQWMGYFERTVSERGWSPVVEEWVPRLLPGLHVALYHALIRTGHAVRAIDALPTTVRQAELARSLAYWAARFRPGASTEDVHPSEEADRTLVGAAARAAAHYVAVPDIFNLHGVTGAMGLDLVAQHLGEEVAGRAWVQLRAEQLSMYPPVDPPATVDPAAGWDEEFGPRAAASHDPHQVKLVEACRRGFEATKDPTFITAARLVTSRRR
jgi:hypothetical protein